MHESNQDCLYFQHLLYLEECTAKKRPGGNTEKTKLGYKNFLVSWHGSKFESNPLGIENR